MILVAEEAKKEALINPECPDKWRTLSMTPLSSDPVILQLQKSLACATLENDLLEAKVSKVNQLQVAPVFFLEGNMVCQSSHMATEQTAM